LCPVARLSSRICATASYIGFEPFALYRTVPIVTSVYQWCSSAFPNLIFSVGYIVYLESTLIWSLVSSQVPPRKCIRRTPSCRLSQRDTHEQLDTSIHPPPLRDCRQRREVRFRHSIRELQSHLPGITSIVSVENHKANADQTYSLPRETHREISPQYV
jgi:hypothetical protein